MVAQIVGFTLFVVLVLGGLCGAAIKFTLRGQVSADLKQRVNSNLWNEAMEQSHLDSKMEMSISDAAERAEAEKHHHKHGGMKMSHATV